MIRQTHGTFIVSSKTTKGKYYELGRDLDCNCKGYFAHGQCRHQKEVEEYITYGCAVDLARRANVETEAWIQQFRRP